MPKRKITSYYRKNKRRRSGLVKRSIRARRSRRMRRFKLPNSNCRLITHRYCDNFSLDAASGTIAKQVFRCNSVFDPDYTGVGRQPMGYDQLSAEFNHYMVVGAKITVTFTSSGSGATTGQGIVGLLVDDDASSPMNVDAIREQRRGSWRVLGTAAASNGSRTLKAYYSPRKQHCLKDKDLPKTLGGTVGANPSEGTFFHVWAAGVNEGVDPGLVQCLVTIEYLTKWTESKTMTES